MKLSFRRTGSTIVIFLLYLTAPLYGQDRGSLAVLDFEGQGISQAEARTLSSRLRSFIVASGEFQVVERGQMMQILEEQDFQTTGCTSNECAVSVGQLLGVTAMVAGNIGKLGQTYSIDVRVIDVGSGRITRSIIWDYKGEIDGLLAQMRNIAEELGGKEVSTKTASVDKSVVKGVTPVGIGVLIQKYPRGRVILKKGGSFTGKNLRIYDGHIVIKYGGRDMQYNNSDVSAILSKSGAGHKFGRGCGGTCASLFLISYIATDGYAVETYDYYTGEYETTSMGFGLLLLGTLSYSGLSYAIGYVIGNALDSWTPVPLKN